MNPPYDSSQARWIARLVAISHHAFEKYLLLVQFSTYKCHKPTRERVRDGCPTIGDQCACVPSSLVCCGLEGYKRGKVGSVVFDWPIYCQLLLSLLLYDCQLTLVTSIHFYQNSTLETRDNVMFLCTLAPYLMSSSQTSPMTAKSYEDKTSKRFILLKVQFFQSHPWPKVMSEFVFWLVLLARWIRRVEIFGVPGSKARATFRFYDYKRALELQPEEIHRKWWRVMHFMCLILWVSGVGLKL